MSSITVAQISKKYSASDPAYALQDINLDVQKGELFGLIGPDGAGKTTLFRILTTLLLANSGSATVQGYDVVKDYLKIRRIVGYMPGRFSLYQDLTVKENLQFFATIFNTTIAANYDLIRDIYVQLEPFESRRAGALSGGMKQKLALCCALIHRPEVLFLDEPTTGVDVVSRKEFWQMLYRLRDEGITIFVSTPYMDEASLCDRIALIQEGQLFSVDTPQNLLDNFSHTIWAVKAQNMFALLKTLSVHPHVASAYSFGEFHHVILSHPGLSIDQLAEELTAAGHTSLVSRETEPTIEDCFLEFMTEKQGA